MAANMQMLPPKTEEELAQEREAAKETLITSYLMYEKTIPETMERRKNKMTKDGTHFYPQNQNEPTRQLMETMKQDVVDRFLSLGYTREEFDEAIAERKAKMKGKRGNNKKILQDVMNKEKIKTDFIEYVEKLKSEVPSFINNDLKIASDNDGFEEYKPNSVEVEESVDKVRSSKVTKTENNDYKVDFKLPEEKDYAANKMMGSSHVEYDLVSLPSRGECYKNKLEKIPVGYLTAYDENLIVSPNLYKDGTFLDEILRAKIMNDKIKADDLLPGDRDAIILWLRGTSYGVDFPVTVTDQESGKQFETTVDLTTIKAKDFKLKGDEDGYFDFTLPVSQDKIKFRFLTYKNLKALEKLDEEENLSIRKERLIDLSEEISRLVNADDDCDKVVKKKLNDSIKNIDDYIDELDVEGDRKFTHAVTNKLAMSIVEVNGVNDRRYINEYVMRMNVRDSSALRRYITENEPGLDFNIEIERPASLGGGSVNMFLTLDQYIFLNIS